MMIPPIYFAIFYDVDKPRTHLYAINQRIPEKSWHNLIDGLPGKEVRLKNYANKINLYHTISHSTFHIFNSVDNHFFAIIDVKKVDYREEPTPIKENEIRNESESKFVRAKW